MQKRTTADAMQQITDRIIDALETGTVGTYRAPWNKGLGGTPRNHVSRKPYRGINWLILQGECAAKGYDVNNWATYKQWQELGGQVRKGEHGTPITYWKFWDREQTAGDDSEQQEDAQETTRATRRPPLCRLYHVFNIAQVDGIQIDLQPEKPAQERIADAEAFFTALPAVVRHGGAQAYYSPAGDYIQMPKFEAFDKAEGYYSVLAHEYTHWTGAVARLDRDMRGRFGDESYAMEELVAELGAAFTCGLLGLALEPREDHAPYIANWLSVLKQDKRAIFTAASKAQQATDYLQEQAARAGEAREAA